MVTLLTLLKNHHLSLSFFRGVLSLVAAVFLSIRGQRDETVNERIIISVYIIYIYAGLSREGMATYCMRGHRGVISYEIRTDRKGHSTEEGITIKTVIYSVYNTIRDHRMWRSVAL